MLRVALDTIYEAIARHQPKKLALACLTLAHWTEREDDFDVERHKLDGRADLLTADLTTQGIASMPIPAAQLDKRSAELLSADMCIVVGEPYYQLLTVGAQVRRLGYQGPIYLEITEGEAQKPQNAQIAVAMARRLHATDLMRHFVYLTKARKTPRNIEFPIDESQSQVEDLPTPLEPAESGRAFLEGRSYEVTQTRIERSADARRKCIEKYGSACAICGFDFAAFYGDSVKGRIHVHHLNPLADATQEREVDPIRDLRPVCPNCHLVIHARSPMYSLEEMGHMIRNRRP